MATRNYQSYMGPTDPNLRHSEIEGYQPVSRIGLCRDPNTPLTPTTPHQHSFLHFDAQVRS